MTAAAKQNGITQSAASHQIREAERRLGIQLVEMNGRLLVLTAAGEKLAEAAGIVGPLLKNAEARAQEYSHGRQRRLRIAYGPQDGLAWVADMAHYLRDLPSPHLLDLIYIESGATALSLSHNQADLALTLDHAAPAKSAIAQRFICEDPLVAIVPPDQPQAHASYLDAESFEDTVYFAHSLTPQSGFELDAFFGPAGTRPGHVAQIQSLGAIIDLVAAGLGVSIQPASTVRAAHKRGEVAIVSLAPPEITHSWYLLARPEFLQAAPDVELEDLTRVLHTPLTLG
ncbi:LysR family transcriptional regulator [Sneathiella marina]|uniref:LysR family transcriptional regulator n=1 Tax=Sneathiella marina TaxID=2950108 RepID=A0ABY4WC97_9PROT|nr:LysR family transcriptional regulator [Sneathiella marina]